MMTLRKLLYLVCLIGLAVSAALAVERIGSPSMAPLLVWSVVVAALAGAPGLVHRRAWPAALVLQPLGAYLLLRTQIALPAHVDGLGGQLSFYVERLRDAAATYAAQEFPLNLSAAPDVAVLVALLVYAATGIAAFLALSLRSALPAVATLMVLLGFGLTVDGSGRVIWLPFLFLIMTGCLLMLSRALERQRWRPGDALAGGVTAVTAILLALSLVGATPVSASIPWQDWRVWGQPGGPDTTALAFDWTLNFPRLLKRPTNVEAMRVTAPRPSYWRANALETFDGRAWTSSGSFARLLGTGGAADSVRYVVRADGPEPRGKLVTEEFTIESISTDFIFSGGEPQALSLDEAAPAYSNRAGALRAGVALGPGAHYTVTAVVPKWKPADLVGRARAYPSAVLGSLALPFPATEDASGPIPESTWLALMAAHPDSREWLGLYRLNRRIVGDASDPYEIALRIERHLRMGYTYSLAPPQSLYRSPYTAFLFDTHVGYCQHFAGAMAVLLRFNGIPARVAVGFSTGKKDADGTFIVGTNDAHAWVETYFPDAGWVTFEPTPGQGIPGAGPSSANAGFVDPFAPAGSAESSASATFGRQPGVRQQKAAGAGREGPTGPRSPAAVPGWWIWTLAIPAALLAWPLWRAAGRRWRLRGGGHEQRLRAELRLLFACLKDYGVCPPPSQTLEETARFLAEDLDIDGATVIDRVQAVLFGGRTPGAEDVAGVAALRREVKRALRVRGGWRRVLLAAYGLPATPR
jgi:hypothetical protein